MTHLGEPSTFTVWLVDSLVEWYVWAVFTPLIFWLAQKYPLNQPPRTKKALILLIYGIILVSVHSVIKIAASYWCFSEPITIETMLRGLGSYYAWNSPLSMLIYVGIIAGATAFIAQIQLRDNQLKASQLETQFTRAQLDTLQRQLEPHFLFNTLNSVSVLMQKGDIARANQTLNDLSDLLRYVLQHQRTQKVTLHEEMELVRRYVGIEQTRFGDRLHVHMDVPTDLLMIPVPSFIVQLCVENAIKHGVTQKMGDANVSVQAKRENGFLQVRIEDDGIGLKEPHDGKSEGIGVSNAKKRLALLYGDNHSFTLQNGNGKGAVAVLRIPIESIETQSSPQEKERA